MKITNVVIAIVLLVGSTGIFAQIVEDSEPTWGIGFNAGVQKPYVDVLHTGIGLAGELTTRFLLSDAFNVSFALGYGQLNDGFDYNTFVTNMMTADLKAHLNLSTNGVFRPYVSFGVGLMNFEYEQNLPWAIGDPNLQGRRYYDTSFILGGGSQFMLSDRVALDAFADYRHTTSDQLDGASRGDAKDGYLNGRVGLTFYMGNKEKEESAEEMLAMDPAEYGAAEAGEFRTESATEYAGAEESVSMERYVLLKSRVDELNNMISRSDQQIQNLESTLSMTDSKIQALESEISEVENAIGNDANSGDFLNRYKIGLGHFYQMDYDQSLSVFQNLLASYPNHKLAANCQYWMGENYFQLTQYQAAEQAFQSVLNAYTDSFKADDATLMLGRCYNKLNDSAQARAYFERVINEYPDSEYVGKAQEWLSRIG